MFTSLNTATIGFSVPFTQALELASSNGFAGLDLPVNELYGIAQQSSVEAIKESFQQAGVRPGGWGLPVEFRHDEETYKRGLENLPRYARLAQELDSPWCGTYILSFSDERDFAANMAFHTERLRPVAQILADHGCKFGIEFVGPKTFRAGHAYEFISTIDGALELGERIGTGNTGLMLDAFHWYTSHATVEDITRLTAEQIVYVHVNDAVAGLGPDEQLDQKRLLPGASGVIDIASFLQAVQRVGYTGPVVVEPFNAELNALPYPERVKATRESLSKIWQIAGLE